MTNTKQIVTQLGNETVWGTIVPPTIEMSGIMDGTSIPPSLQTQIYNTQRGSMGPGVHAQGVFHEVSGSVPVYMIYEEFCYWMNLLDAATEAGSGPYTQTYGAPEDTAVTPDFMTLTHGAGDSVVGVTSACASSIDISWSFGELVTSTVNLMGHSVVADTLAALSPTDDEDLTYASGCHASVYIDTWGGTMGSTEFTKCLSGNFTIDAQRQYLGYGGSCYPGGVFDPMGWNITGSLTLESDATSAGYVDAILSAATKKLIRIDFNNGEAAADERGAQFDIMALINVDSVHTDDSGLMTHTISFESIQEDDNDYFTAVVTNNVAAIWA